MKKIGIITSKGGHFFETMKLGPILKEHSCFWVTFPGKDVDSIKGQKKYFAHYPESRNIPNFIRNFFQAFSIFRIEKPDILISCGAGIAVPFFIVGKVFFKTKLLYIESYDFVAYPSMTGKLVYNFVDLFLVQHRHQKQWYKKAHYWGSLL